MAFAGFDSIHALRQIQAANNQASSDFLIRTQILERVRGAVYVSGTYVRDFVLEPELGKAQEDREAALHTRPKVDAALGEYQGLLHTNEKDLFQSLRQELTEYWAMIDPVLGWTPAERRVAGYAFLRDEVFVRRTSILRLTDQIGGLATERLSQEELDVAATYAEYRKWLMVTVGFTIGLGFMLAAYSVRQIFELEKETQERYREISELSARLLQAQEDERRSIARELHDEVGQSLTGVLVEMANLSMLVRSQKLDALEPKATEIKRQVENSISVVRNMALLLRPPMLDDLGLLPALRWQARETARHSPVRVKIAAEGISENLTDDIKTCIYRIVQEALHNVIQHAEARTVRISLEEKQGHIYLSIQDDGKGFVAKEDRGMGLLGMEERVSHLGGSFAIESAPGEGAMLRVILPLSL